MATTINRAIKDIMKAEGVTQMAMAQSIGKGRPNDVSARLNNENMTFDKAIEMLQVMGYEVVVQKRKPGRRADGQTLIGMSKANK